MCARRGPPFPQPEGPKWEMQGLGEILARPLLGTWLLSPAVCSTLGIMLRKGKACTPTWSTSIND